MAASKRPRVLSASMWLAISADFGIAVIAVQVDAVGVAPHAAREAVRVEHGKNRDIERREKIGSAQAFRAGPAARKFHLRGCPPKDRGWEDSFRGRCVGARAACCSGRDSNSGFPSLRRLVPAHGHNRPDGRWPGPSWMGGPVILEMIDQPIGRAVVGGDRAGRFELGQDRLRQLLAELDAPLVERVDVPDDALRENLVLV
jgi:hypothetical protein